MIFCCRLYFYDRLIFCCRLYFYDRLIFCTRLYFYDRLIFCCRLYFYDRLIFCTRLYFYDRLIFCCRLYFYDRLIFCCRLYFGVLYLLRNSALIRKELSSETTKSLHQILGRFVLSWKQQEELRRQKEAEEGLYKYRVKVHGDDRDNEEIEEEEFRQNFPSFQQVRGQKSHR